MTTWCECSPPASLSWERREGKGVPDANLLKARDLAGSEGSGIQHQHGSEAEDVPEQLVVLQAELVELRLVG